MTVPESVLAGAPWGGVALVQVTLVALLGLLAWLAARRGGPALRGAVLLAALVGLLVVPGLAVVAPTWLPLPECLCPASVEQLAPGSAGAGPAPPPPAAADSAVLAIRLKQPPAGGPFDTEEAGQQAGEATLAAGQIEGLVFNLADPPEESTSPAPAEEQVRSSWPLVGILAAVWLLGALACLSLTFWRLARLYRSVYRARPVGDKAWTDCVKSLAGHEGLPAVALRESAAVTSPLTLGLLRPVILLPTDRRNWSAEERALILGHELAHVSRRDFLAGLVAELVACLCWFHPLVRWLAGRLRLEQEYAADAWVASAMSDSRAYVWCLARLALEQSGERTSPAPALWRRRPEILRRIDMLQRNPKGLPSRIGKRSAWVVAVLAAAACLMVAGVGPLHSAGDGQKATASAPDARSRPTADPHGDALPADALARLGTTRLRHGGDVTYVAFGADGKTLLTAGQDGTVRLWDLARNKEVRQFVRPRPAPPKPQKGDKPIRPDNLMQLMAGARGGGAFRVALSPDGKTLAAAGGNVIQLWEVETGKELRQIKGPPGGLAGLLFSPDGRTLAGRTSGGALFVWAANTGKEIHHFQPARRKQNGDFVLFFGGGPGAVAPGMAFTPDGKTLVAAMTDYKEQKANRSIKFWEVASGKEIRAIKLPDGGSATAVTLTPDGKVLAYERGFTVHLCEANTGKEIRKIQIGGAALSLVFLPDGKTLVTRTRNQRVRVWDTQSGKEIRQLSEAAPPPRTGNGLMIVSDDFFSPEVRALALSADGKRIAAAAGNTVRLWNTSTGKELPLVGGHWRAPSTVVVSPDGKSVVSWGADRVVRRWEAATGKSLGEFPAPPRTTLAAFSRDNRMVALANADNTIRLHDTTTGKELSRFKGPPNGLAALAFAPGGKVLALRGSGDNTVRLYDVKRGVELRQVAIRPKARPNQGGTVIVFGGPARGASGTGPGLAFSPDGKLLVAPLSGNGDRSKTLVFLDAASGKELRKIESASPIASFAFAPDGRSLATENANRTITLWEVASGKAQGQLGKAVAGPPPRNAGMMATVVIDGLPGSSVEPGGPVGVTYSPDGRMLAVRGADRAVHVWDVAAAKEVGQLKGHTGRIETVAFAPNGKSLASGANDTTILLWDVAGPRKELSKPGTVQLPAEEVEKLWSTLAGEDAARAHQSVSKLAAAPKQAIPFLGQHLKPAVRIDPEKIKRWIADLESEKFSVRRAAATNLLKVGEQSLPALRQTLASVPQLETRKRLENLVDRLTGGTLTAEELRLVRAVEALERMATPEAGKLLRTLAEGAPGALPTREAQAALARLAGR